jgi:metallophosphoesterase superfamily enzyme
MVPFSFAGETFVASAEGALHWPAQQALLVADLHLEKASWFARLGQFLPPYDSVATLTALRSVVETTGVRKLFCLGDSFHDRFGCDRLPEPARSLLTEMTERLEWHGFSAITIRGSRIIAAAPSSRKWKSPESSFAMKRIATIPSRKCRGISIRNIA